VLRTLLLIGGIAVGAAGCFSPSFDACAVECGAGDSCPSGMSCLADGICHRSMSEALCAPRPDADPNQPDADPDQPDADPNQPDAGPPVTPDTAGQLVISEIMIDSVANPDQVHEWFELHNPSDSVTYDLLGLQVGDTVFDFFEIDTSVLIRPGAYVVLGESDDQGMNGGVEVVFDYADDAFNLTNGADEVIVYNPVADVNIDDVAYGASWFSTGAALSLDPDSLNSVDNDSQVSWCDGSTPFGTDGDMGSPTDPNPDCP
jgi:lamin tail-like protein